MVRLAIAAVVLCSAAFGQAPSPEEQRQFLERTRQIALDYSNLLPDFVCTEVITRSSDESGTMRFLDTLMVQLTYAGKREEYKLMLDGKPSDQPLESYWGALSFGEFGSTLRLIFEPRSRTEFQWEKATTVDKRPVAVYSFRVPLAYSPYSLGFGVMGKSQSALVGLRGRLIVENGTGLVRRLTSEAEEIPNDFPIRESSTTIEYAFAEVGGRRYLLPARAETWMMYLRALQPSRRSKGGMARYRNVVDFRDYRKFAVDSKMTFGEDGK